ncbi:MAG TPA: hypothetical protein VG938_08380 [Verrucomicrobiae bacterium]|jgi:hypothetical protein|nr:hypothetical protein [Verrucomicrobiae bacterium]
MKRLGSSCLLLMLFALLLLAASGCASTEPDNASVRPWDSPMGWENGIPSGMYQQH